MKKALYLDKKVVYYSISTTVMKTGVYTITNTTDGKVYVGYAKNIHARLRAHKYYLKEGKHANKTYLRLYYQILSIENHIQLKTRPNGKRKTQTQFVPG